jgi:hypothetical protein
VTQSLGIEAGLKKGCLSDACKLEQQEHEIQNKNIINKMTEDCHHIIVNHAADQEGQDIRDEDVAQPLNHRHACQHAIGEIKKWKLKSNPRCPTHGSCMRCMKIRPAGRSCDDCQEGGHQSRHVILMNNQRILDSVALAQMLKQGQETAKADRHTHARLNKIQSFGIDHFTIAAKQRMHEEAKEDPVAAEASSIYELNMQFHDTMLDQQTAQQRQQECSGRNV